MMPKTPIDSNPELRAFIYQELTDLEGLLPEGTAISIVLGDKAKNRKISIHLESKIGSLFVESQGKDIFKVIRKAKEDLKSQLSTLQSFLISTEDRNKNIENIINKNYLH